MATLTLGGPSVLGGCYGTHTSGSSDGGVGVDGGSEIVRAFCEQAVDCGSYGYADACVASIQAYPSYYEVACNNAIRRALACIVEQGGCGFPAVCADESQAIAEACRSTNPPPDQAYAICQWIVDCYGDYYYDVSSCVDAFDYYGQLGMYEPCFQAVYDLYACAAANLACGGLYAEDLGACTDAYNAYNDACAYY